MHDGKVPLGIAIYQLQKKTHFIETDYDAFDLQNGGEELQFWTTLKGLA